MEKSTFAISINGQYDFELDAAAREELDMTLQTDGTWHILQNEKAYIAELVYSDFERKVMHLKLNGRTYEVSMADHYDLLVKKLGLSVASSTKVNEVKAPMPGLVLEVAVEAGQTVQKGDALLILEAMKMENVIKSIGDGIVKDILIEKGAAVDKGQLLIQME